MSRLEGPVSANSILPNLALNATYEPPRGSSLLSGDRGAPYMLQALAAWRADGWDSNDAPRQLVELDELERALTKQGEAESDLGLK